MGWFKKREQSLTPPFGKIIANSTMLVAHVFAPPANFWLELPLELPANKIGAAVCKH